MSSSSSSSMLLELLGSPTAVVGFGVTTAVLLGTTYYLTTIQKSKGGGGANDGIAGSSGGANKGNGTANGGSACSTNGSGAHAKAEELDRTKYPGGHLTIYYGSQTGTAQMFAKQIESECESRGFSPRVVDLQDVVDNEDDAAMDAMRAEYAAESRGIDGDGGLDELDEDGAIIRATLAHPHYRDVDVEEDGGGGSGSSGADRKRQRSKALFFMATYGEGEPTDNAQQFVEIMKGKSGISNIYKFQQQQGQQSDVANGGTGGGVEAPSTMGSAEMDDVDPASASGEGGAAATTGRDPAFLDDLDYAVFGLGNKQYEHYNNMSRFADAALEQCGARRIAPIGLGDDDDDLEGDFETWKDNVFWPAMNESYVKGKVVAEKKKGAGGNKLPPCPYKVQYLKEDERVDVGMNSAIQTSSKHYLQAKDVTVSARRELRDPSDPGSTVHMEIDVGGTLQYHTADNLGILPRNDASIVEAVAEALGYDLDARFHLLPNNDADGDEGGSNNNNKNAKHTLPFPTPCTVRECLERYCDLTGPPRRSDLKQLAPYARDDIDRKALLRMSSKEGKAEYREKIVDAHVGIADIVTRLCKSVACPLEHFASMVCPRLQPRYYTISSSSTVHPTSVHVTLAVLESERKDGGKFTGLCSGYLAGLSVGDTVRAFVRESTFRLPKEAERPVVMFGPGTGIAPMRAILQERSHERRTEDGGVEKHGPNILYFGCKKRNMDYIYRDELESFEKEGTLTELHLAFSRERPEKVYVQHLLAERAAETWKLVHDGKASIFVCGAVKMGADVDHALQKIISQEGGMGREEAKAYLDRMAVSGRFVQELWS